MKKGKTRLWLIIAFLFAITGIVSTTYFVKNTTNLGYAASTDNQDILYEGIGHYQFKTAGSMNIVVKANDDGTFTEEDVNNFNNSVSGKVSMLAHTPVSARKFVKDTTGFTSIDNDTSITNISGSYLEINGTAKKAYLYVCANFDGIKTGNFITLVTPSGKKISLENSKTDVLYTKGENLGKTEITQARIYYDITDIVKEEGKGWYYVSMNGLVLDGRITTEYGNWAIIAIDENSQYNNQYVKLVHNYKSFNGESHGFSITSALNITNSLSFTGLVVDAEPAMVDTWKAMFYLIDGDNKIEMQSMTASDGTPYFKDRYNNISFLYSVFDSVKKEPLNSYKNGYEFDLFNYTIPTDKINSTNTLNFEIIASESNGILTTLFGIGIEVDTPNAAITTKIENKTSSTSITKGNTIHTTTNANNSSKNGSCAILYNAFVTSSVDESLSNVTNIVVKKNGSTVKGLTASYNSTTKKVVTSTIDSLNCSDVITIEYDATVNDNIVKKEKDANGNIILPTEAVIKGYPFDYNSLSDSLKAEYKNQTLEVTAYDKINSKLLLVPLTVNYQTESGIKLTDSIIEYKNIGESYTTEAKEFDIYELIAIPDNASGIMPDGGETVNYIYKLKDPTIDGYIDKIGTDKITSKEDPIRYSIAFGIELTYFEGTATVTLKDQLPYEINLEESDIADGTYDKESKTITWTETYTISNFDEVNNIKLQKDILVKYENVDYTKDIVNKISGTVKLNDEEKTLTDEVTTKVEIPAKVIVNHFDSTGELLKTETTDVNLGDEYKTNPSAELLEKYKLSSVDGNEEGIVDQEEIVVNYYYELSNVSTPNTNKDISLLIIIGSTIGLIGAIIVIISQKKVLHKN